MAKKLFTETQEKQICDEYCSDPKMTMKALAKKYNCSVAPIRAALTKHQIDVRQTREYLKSFDNEDFFQNIDTQVKAYWLGYIAADATVCDNVGSLRAFRFFLAEKDRNAVFRLAQDLNFTGTIYYCGKQQQFGIAFNSEKFCHDLENHGIIDWKSKGDPQKLLSNVPLHLMSHFILGFFDGDGGISVNSNSRKQTKQYYLRFSADKDHCQIHQAIEKQISSATGVNKPGYKIKENCSYQNWFGNGNVEKICHWMYKDHAVKLDRKYAKYLAVQNRDFLSFWQTIHKWEFKYDVRELSRLKSDSEVEDIITRFAEVVRHGFEPLKFPGKAGKKEMRNDLWDLETCNYQKTIKEDRIIPYSRSYGNKIVLHNQQAIWRVSQNGRKTFYDLVDCPRKCYRAVKAMLTTGTKINPTRLIRELIHAGVSRASILSCPTIMAVIKKFGLVGKWCDPCSGWGNRLVAAYVLQLPYEGGDPAPEQYHGLVRIKEQLGSTAVLHHGCMEQTGFPPSDFIFTSPPFFDKEDYGLNRFDSSFEVWYQTFLLKLVHEGRRTSKRIVLHIDNPMCERLEADYNLDKVRYDNASRSKAAPNEWFVEILDPR